MCAHTHTHTHMHRCMRIYNLLPPYPLPSPSMCILSYSSQGKSVVHSSNHDTSTSTKKPIETSKATHLNGEASLRHGCQKQRQHGLQAWKTWGWCLFVLLFHTVGRCTFNILNWWACVRWSLFLGCTFQFYVLLHWDGSSRLHSIFWTDEHA